MNNLGQENKLNLKITQKLTEVKNRNFLFSLKVFKNYEG